MVRKGGQCAKECKYLATKRTESKGIKKATLADFTS
ncbi:hypothetical protein A2U01_0098220, partial [Trifolium medium]|nr:hypothetical protein [Trifolium medium]